jgi:putative transposase
MNPLIPYAYYHIYNRAIGNEKLFLNEDNYLFFLKRFKELVLPELEVYCYCLMPNHFHFLVSIKEAKNPGEVEKKFSNFFSSYTQSFNKVNQRKGSLFIKTFKRKQITDKNYLIKLVHYIHYNPVNAGLVSHPIEWNYSSYKSIISTAPSNLNRQEVLNWFEDLDNFLFMHQLKCNAPFEFHED